MSPSDEAAARLKRLARDLATDGDCLDGHARQIARAAASSSSPEAAALLAVSLHHYYTAFETALERTFRALEGDVPSGGDWHRALLDEACKGLEGIRPVIVSDEIADDLRELLRFRHFFRHAYAVPLDWSKLTANASRVSTIHDGVKADLDRLLDHVRRAVDAANG